LRQAAGQRATMLLLPACLLSVFVMYWSLPIGCLLYRIRFLDITSRKRADMFRWAELLLDWFRVKVYKVGSRGLYKGQRPVVYLCNHRSWADFFIDKYLTEAEGAPLSRWAVFYVFPVFLVSARWFRHIIFFKRIRVADKEAFNRKLAAQMQHSFTNGLIVYPEGHRSTLPDSLPLKHGILFFTHSQKLHVQVIITKGKEQLLSEKKLSAHFNARLACGYGEPIDCAQYPDVDAFVARVQQEWDRLWLEVYGADVDSLPVLRVGEGDSATQDFPRYILVGQVAIGSVSIVLFLALLYVCVRLALSSIPAMTVAALLAAWTAVSLQKATLVPGSRL
jgi:1-acyl-sn-glycerol-3-phosphate acyltransferase